VVEDYGKKTDFNTLSNLKNKEENMNTKKLYAFSTVVIELSSENRIPDAARMVLGYLNSEEEAFVFKHLESGHHKVMENVSVTNESDNSKRLALVGKLKDEIRKQRASK
jgi:hypothetical protein